MGLCVADLNICVADLDMCVLDPDICVAVADPYICVPFTDLCVLDLDICTCIPASECMCSGFGYTVCVADRDIFFSHMGGPLGTPPFSKLKGTWQRHGFSEVFA
jgi:hypothetical protein